MPYAKLLDQLIKTSGMTAKEVAEKCKEQGAAITPSYLSMLRNGSGKRMPSDDVSKALARVLGKDESLLVVERALDESPEPILKALQNLTLNMAAALCIGTGQKIDPQIEEQLRILVEQTPLAESVLKMAQEAKIPDYDAKAFSVQEIDEENHTTININGIPEFDATDNSMYPTIKKGDKIKIKAQPDMHTGEIIAFTEKGKEGIQYRQVQQIEDHYLLVAFNSEFPPMQVNPKTMLLLGRVIAVTTML